MLQNLDPIYASDINIVAWGAVGALIVSAPRLIAPVLTILANIARNAANDIPQGIKGTAAWSKSRRDIKDLILKPGLFKTGHGAYWGCYRKWGVFGLFRKPIITKQPAVSAIYGSTGSGKGIYHMLINMMSVPGPKMVIDFDGTETVMMAETLRKKGEIVRILNFDDKFGDILGPSDCFNILDHIFDGFEVINGCNITDVLSDVTGIANDLYPEPETSTNDNEYFREGSRTLIKVATIIALLFYGRDATVGHVLNLIQDADEFLIQCRLLCGELKQEGGPNAKLDITRSEWAHRQDPDDIRRFSLSLAKLAKRTAVLIDGDRKAFEPFQTGAAQRLSNFDPAMRSSKKLERSTFKFSDQKEDGPPTTVFIVLDNTKLDAQEDLLTAITSVARKEWVRHPNAGHVPITVFLNEINNWTYKGITSLYSWARKYKLHLIAYLQNESTYKNRYSEESLDALWSEADFKLILPSGVKEPRLLKRIEEALGNKSVMVKSRTRADGTLLDAGSISYSEQSAPLMDADKIRRNGDHGILLIKDRKPIKTYFTSVASVARFRKAQGINPLYGRPHIERVKLWLLRYEPWMPANITASHRNKTRASTSRQDARSGGRNA